MSNKKTLQEAHDEIFLYTLGHAGRDSLFIHQYAVDAWAAQYADEDSKPIKVAFALIGLYLYLARDYSGKAVQNAHVWLGKRRTSWPLFDLPSDRGDITVFDVLEASPGEERDAMIKEWCISVWDAWKDSHAQVEKLVHEEMDAKGYRI